MVKRKKNVVYRYRTKKRKASTGTGMFSKLGKPIGSMLYGAVREKISTSVANTEIGQKLPVTQFTDEAVMLGIMFGARKLGAGKKGLVASMIRNGEVVEYARIGQTITDIYLNKGTGSATTSSGSNW